jgi:hypothetical protein
MYFISLQSSENVGSIFLKLFLHDSLPLGRRTTLQREAIPPWRKHFLISSQISTCETGEKAGAPFTLFTEKWLSRISSDPPIASSSHLWKNLTAKVPTCLPAQASWFSPLQVIHQGGSREERLGRRRVFGA